MATLPPLRFRPILKRALWGGSRLEQELGKPAGGVPDAAESWEVVDLPGNDSVVAEGALQGMTLRQLMTESAAELLGRHRHLQQFPLLIKFLDARQQLSVQVHPKDPTLMPDGTLRPGKTESWIVLDADPGNQMSLGLHAGITESDLRQAVKDSDFASCLHTYEAKSGDCIHLSPGTVHALGGGLLIAEIQQPSDITYRLYDWDRRDAHGDPRELHIEQSFAATNFEIGPVFPVKPRPLEYRKGSEVLVDCPHYRILRHRGPAPLELPQDETMHCLVVVSGSVSSQGLSLKRGETIVIPASRKAMTWELSDDAELLDSYLPG